ncbi:hypothetical protein GYB57_09610 [bacterium]|nr:hypothetical protein [bacterium]
MKNVLKNKLILITLTLFVGGLIGWLIKPSSTDAMKEESTHLHEESNDQEWTCSMHPQIRKNEPGDCPICGMDLIPISEDQNTEENPDAIRMSPTAMQLANVQTA